MSILENKKVLLNSIIFMLLTIILSSCTKVDVYFPTQFVKDNKVLINGKHDLSEFTQEKEYSFISLGYGVIEVSINGKEREINTMNGGLLNLNQEEFVVFTIVYGTAYQSPFPVPFSAIIDSVFYYQDGYNEPRFNRYKNNGQPPYDRKNAEMFGYAVITKDDFFAEKSWDLEMYDEIPETMTVQVREGSGSALGGKRTIRSGKMFKLMASFSKQYGSIDLRNSN